MRYTIAPFAIAACLINETGGSSLAAERSLPDAVIQTISGMFDAMRDADRTRWTQLVAPDFRIFENGKDMSGDEMYGFVRDIFDHGRQVEWSVTDARGEIEGNLAVVQYVNRGAITTNGKRQPIIWFETAALRQVAGRWRLAFMQSERAKPSATRE